MAAGLIGTVVLPASPASAATLFGVNVPGNTLTTLASGLGQAEMIALDSAGNVYIASFGGQLLVLPKSTGSLFGVAVTANMVTTLLSSGLNGAIGLAFDSAGDLFIANAGTSAVSVLPKSSGTLFGVAVTANTLATVVTGLSEPRGLAVDAAGNLYIADFFSKNVLVLPRSTGSLFGVPVTAGTLATVLSGQSNPAALAFDSAGDLYVADYGSNTVAVLPKSTGTFFGVSGTINTLTNVVSSGLTRPGGLAFDSAGDLYIGELVSPSGSVYVLPKSTGSLFGVTVTADTLATLVPGLNAPEGLALDSAGDLYISTLGAGTLSALAPLQPQTITFTSSAPTTATVGGAAYTVTATASSGLPVTFSLDTTSTGCSLTSSTVSFTSSGTCVIDANQAGNTTFAPAPQVTQSFSVSGAPSKVTLTLVAPSRPGGPIGITATVSPDTPSPALPALTGTVRFTISGVTCPSGTNALTLVSGAATCSVASTTGGLVKAAYSGSATYKASSASAVMGSASLASPVAVWVGSQNAWSVNAQLYSGGFGAPGGDVVTFTSGGVTLCRGVTDTQGVANCLVSPSATVKAGAIFTGNFAGNTLLLATTSPNGSLPAT